jgi:hypothetical protein
MRARTSAGSGISASAQGVVCPEISDSHSSLLGSSSLNDLWQMMTETARMLKKGGRDSGIVNQPSFHSAPCRLMKLKIGRILSGRDEIRDLPCIHSGIPNPR